MKPCVFLFGTKKSRWQNSQFFRESVDKIGKMDYIVKSKTNGCGKIFYLAGCMQSVCYSFFTITLHLGGVLK